MSHTEHETPQSGNLAHEERASQVELAMLLSKVQETNKALARSNVESAQIIAQLEDTKGLLRDELARYHQAVTMVEAQLSCAIESLHGISDAYGKQTISSPDYCYELMLSVEQPLILASGILGSIRSLDMKSCAATSVADFKQQMMAILQRVQRAANGKGIRINADIAPDLPNQLWIPLTQLQLATGELLGNAVKHSQADSITLKFNYNPNQEGDATLEVLVADNGCGVTGETLQHLRYLLARQAVEKKLAASTGMGYRLLARLIEITDGELDIQSSPSHGFTAKLRMPVGSANHASWESQHVMSVKPKGTTETPKLHLALLADSTESAEQILGGLTTAVWENLECQVLTNWQEIADFISNKSLRPACLLLLGETSQKSMVRVLQEFSVDNNQICSLYLASPTEEIDMEKLRAAGISGLVRLPIEGRDMRRLLEAVWKRMTACDAV